MIQFFFFFGQSYLFNDGAELYLIFQTFYYTLKKLGYTEKTVSWKPKCLSPKKLTTPTTSDSVSLSIKCYRNSNFCLVFKESCLKQQQQQQKKTQLILLQINYFIISELDTWSQDLNSDFTLKDCLFGDVKLATNADPGK